MTAVDRVLLDEAHRILIEGSCTVQVKRQFFAHFWALDEDSVQQPRRQVLPWREPATVQLAPTRPAMLLVLDGWAQNEEDRKSSSLRTMTRNLP